MSYPQFDKIENSHFVPAFERGMEEHLAEIEAIANQTEAPSLDNTLIPMERSGQTLNRVATVFFSLTAANTNDEMEAIRSDMAPKLSAHRDQILLNSKLFARIQAIYEQRDSLELDPESYRLIEENYKGLHPRRRTAFRGRQGKTQGNERRNGLLADQIQPKRNGRG